MQSDYLTFKPANSEIHVPKILDTNIMCQYPQIRQSLMASIRSRNIQMQQLNPSYCAPIKEVEDDLNLIKQKTIEDESEDLQKSQMIFQSGLINKSWIRSEMKGSLYKRSKSIFHSKVKVFCHFVDGILSIYKEKNMKKATIVLNFHLFNFLYFVKKDQGKVTEFGLKCDSHDKVFIFSGEEISKWFYLIEKVIKEQREKPKYQFYINPFPDFYKKHLIHNKQFLEMAQSGDVILFQGKCVSAKLQRMLTRSEYDHVAMVLKYANGQIYALEATGGAGVGIFSWENMVSKGWYELYNLVVYRRLDVERTTKFLMELESFVKDNLGKEYRLSVSKLLNQKSVIITKQQQGLSQEETEKTYFCSQLIAQAYKAVGILQTDVSSTQFWPNSFSNESEDLKLTNATLSDEYLIGFNM